MTLKAEFTFGQFGSEIQVEAQADDRLAKQVWIFRHYGGHGLLIRSYESLGRKTPRHKFIQSCNYGGWGQHFKIKLKDVPLPAEVIDAVRQCAAEYYKTVPIGKDLPISKQP